MVKSTQSGMFNLVQKRIDQQGLPPGPISFGVFSNYHTWKPTDEPALPTTLHLPLGHH